MDTLTELLSSGLYFRLVRERNLVFGIWNLFAPLAGRILVSCIFLTFRFWPKSFTPWTTVSRAIGRPRKGKIIRTVTPSFGTSAPPRDNA